MGRPRRTPAGTGILSGLDADAESSASTTDSVLRNIYPGNSFISNKNQGSYGNLVSMEMHEGEMAESYAVFEHPNKNAIIKTGGVNDDGSGPVSEYNLTTGEWDTEGYDQLGDSVDVGGQTFTVTDDGSYLPGAYDVLEAEIDDGDPDSTVDMALFISGEYDDVIENICFGIILEDAGIYEEGDIIASIYPSPHEAYNIPAAAHEGSLYFFGGWTGDPVDSVVYRATPTLPNEDESFSIEFEELEEIPEPSRGGGRCPVVNGEMYINGYWDDNGLAFYKYSIGEDEFTRLEDYPDDKPNLGGSVLYEFNGNIIHLDGYGWFDDEVSYYSIEGGEWTYMGSGLEDKPWEGENYGAVVDGVAYMPGTGGDDDCFWAYVPEEDPFDN